MAVLHDFRHNYVSICCSIKISSNRRFINLYWTDIGIKSNFRLFFTRLLTHIFGNIFLLLTKELKFCNLMSIFTHFSNSSFSLAYPNPRGQRG